VRTPARQSGFSTLELLATLAVIGVIAAAAVPSTSRTLQDLRLRGDAHGVQNAVALAKMRAAARFTRERIYVDLSTGSYHLEYWDRSLSTPNWVDELDPTVNIQTGVNFGYGSLTTPPPDTQSSIGQSPACKTNSGSDIGGTACIVFNSRGIPVTGTGSVTGNSALYVTDGLGTYGVTVSATPLVRLWWTPATSANWKHR
jgi:prepilin-type N-terminal cleavage/methylation domain-containing protein